MRLSIPSLTAIGVAIWIAVILTISARCGAGAPPPLQPAGSMVQPRTFAAALGESVRQATAGTIKATREMPRHAPGVSQLPFPACTGASVANVMNAQPLMGSVDRAWALSLWRQARDRIPWARGDETSGASLWDALQIVRQRGLVVKLETLDSEVDMRRTVLQRGPFVLSTPWLASMNTPTADGRLQARGAWLGDHAIAVLWYDEIASEYILLQSWGGYAPFDRFGQVVRLRRSGMRDLVRKGAFGLFAKKLHKAK